LLTVGGHAGVQANPEHFRRFPSLAKNVIEEEILREGTRAGPEKWPIKIGAAAISAVNHPKLFIDLSSITFHQ
jgi:hypothetical protein